MSDSIKPGDWVQVVRGNGCKKCYQKSLGLILQVMETVGPRRTWTCAECGGPAYDSTELEALCDNNGLYQFSRLKKIPPLSEPESVEHREELKA